MVDSLESTEWEPVDPSGDDITPLMLRAGVAAFCAHDARLEGIEDAVIRIYRRMIAAKP